MITIRPQFLPVKTAEGWVYINQNFIECIKETEDEKDWFFVHGKDEPIKAETAVDLEIVDIGTGLESNEIDIRPVEGALLNVAGEIDCLR